MNNDNKNNHLKCLLENNNNDIECSIRPKYFNEYIGQKKIKENLNIYISAAKLRKENLEHIILYGPPGLGKTTLASIIANEMNSTIKTLSAPTVEKNSDLITILTKLNDKDVLFIDEIHRLNIAVEETLYSAMEDNKIDIIIGQGSSTRIIEISLPKFTLIGATTKIGQLSSPLRDRFGFHFRLEKYSIYDIECIVYRSAQLLNINCDKDGAHEIAIRSRGIPRIANRLLKRVRDFAQVKFQDIINKESSNISFQYLEIDSLGLDNIDRLFLQCIINNFNGGPVGIETISSLIGEESSTLEDMYEPYLMEIGFLIKTRRGRCITELAKKYFKK